MFNIYTLCIIYNVQWIHDIIILKEEKEYDMEFYIES